MNCLMQFRNFFFANLNNILQTCMFSALREFFRAKNGNCACMEFSSGELTRDMGLPQGENERINLEIHQENENRRLEGPTEGSLGGSNRHLSSTGSFVQLNDAADEFFDVPDESEYDQREIMFPSDESTHAVVSSFCVCIENCQANRLFLSIKSVLLHPTQIIFWS